MREEKTEDGRFGCSMAFHADFDWEAPFYFDGIGVRVSFCDELELAV